MPALLAKQSTALTVRIGPILDADGVEYAGAVIGDISITKNGTTAAMAAAATLTYDANGYYSLVTTTANMDALGALQITCNKSGYQMPVFERLVVPANVYDAIVLGSDKLQVDAVEISGDSTAADTLELFVEALDQVTGQIDSETLADNALTAAALAADAVVEIQSGLSTLDAAGVRTAVGLASANLDTQLADLPTVSEFNARTVAAADYATAAVQTQILDTVSYNAAALYGACADPQTSAETYAITINGSTYALDYTSQTAAGVRGTTTRTKS